MAKKKRKLEGLSIIYLSNQCPHCIKIYENREEIRIIYLKYVEDIDFRFVESNREFLAYGFERVPTLILPHYRPFEAIEPDILMNEDYLKQMIAGTLLPCDVHHITEIKRIEKGIVFNENLDKLLGIGE